MPRPGPPGLSPAGIPDRFLLVLTTAAILALAILAGTAGRGNPELVGAVLLLLSADLATTSRVRRVALVGGAALLVLAVNPVEGMPSRLLALAVLAVLAWAWPAVVQRLGPVVGSLLLTGSVLGVYATVPDTEEILAVAIVVPALAVLTAGPAQRAPGLALLGLLVWATVEGGRGRPGGMVGGVICLGLLAVPALMAGRREGRPPWSLGSAVLVVQAVAVVIVSRVAGFETGALDAALIAAPVCLGAAAVHHLLLRTSDEHAPANGRP